MLVGFDSDISSLALFIRPPCFAWLAPLLSFRSSYAPGFLILFLFVRCCCLSSSGGTLYAHFFSSSLSSSSSLRLSLVMSRSFCPFGIFRAVFFFFLYGLWASQSSSASVALLRCLWVFLFYFLLFSSPGHLCSVYSTPCLIYLCGLFLCWSSCRL